MSIPKVDPALHDPGPSTGPSGNVPAAPPRLMRSTSHGQTPPAVCLRSPSRDAIRSFQGPRISHTAGETLCARQISKWPDAATRRKLYLAAVPALRDLAVKADCLRDLVARRAGMQGRGLCPYAHKPRRTSKKLGCPTDRSRCRGTAHQTNMITAKSVHDARPAPRNVAKLSV